jgi:hypothetical protein
LVEFALLAITPAMAVTAIPKACNLQRFAATEPFSPLSSPKELKKKISLFSILLAI